MHLIITSATAFEVLPLLTFLNERGKPLDAATWDWEGLRVELLVTGVGLVATAVHTTRRLTQQSPDWIWNVGIAGSLRADWGPGTVVQVQTECLADLGVEEADGQFTDMFALGLIEADVFPFKGGKLHNPAEPGAFLPIANGLSVQTVHGFEPSIQKIREKYPEGDVETMEGAAFFYAALTTNTPFLAIRAISNMVEPRNRDHWQIPLAIQNLQASLISMLNSLREAG